MHTMHSFRSIGRVRGTVGVSPYTLKDAFFWEERIFPQSSIVRFGMGRVDPCSHPHEFAQSHIGERHLPPLPYKHLALGRVYPSAVRLLWEEFRLNPQLGIVCFGMGKD